MAHVKYVPVPEQREGDEKNIEATIEAGSVEEARKLYRKAKARLLDVNRWRQICGKLSANFQLTNEQGEHVEGHPREGYYFKIDIPGPGTVLGGGYDWVRVEEVTEHATRDVEYVLIRVRPAANPSAAGDNVAHFFSDKSTSNFVVKRERNAVIAAVYGRNETPNTETNHSVDKARNTLVGSGAITAFSYPQWKSLVNSVLGKRTFPISIVAVLLSALVAWILSAFFVKRNR